MVIIDNSEYTLSIDTKIMNMIKYILVFIDISIYNFIR